MTSTMTAGAATLRFDPANGGTLAVTLDGQELLTPAPALSLVLDGKPISGWREVVATAGETLVLRGLVDAAVMAELSISRLADRGCFEFALNVENCSLGSLPDMPHTSKALASK